MKQSLLVYAVLTISLSSCTNNVKIEEKSNENVSIINIDESGVIDEYNLSEFVTNINYLILETRIL